MRASEFIVEYKTEEYNGLRFTTDIKNGQLIVRALDDWGTNELGHVVFNIGDQDELDPQDLEVDDRYQGQGIAKTMYDYVKTLGYEIHRSWDQTPAGAGFWNKHRGEERVWEDQGGIDFKVSKDNDGVAIKATAGDKQLGYAELFFDDEGNLDPQAIWVDERFRGQGIGSAMYDYLKRLGYTIIRSWDQTDDSKGMWDKHRGADVNVWEGVPQPGQSSGAPTQFAQQNVDENFADGKVKGKSRPGRVKRAGASCDGSVTDLRAKAKKYGGEKGKMYHWCANMKGGKNK